MHSILLTLHTYMRYLVLILVVYALVKSIAGWLSKKPFLAADRKTAMFGLMSVHIQFVIGLILYFVSPIVQMALSDMGSAMKNSELRFWSVEHTLMMLVAIVLVTIGYSKAKRSELSGHKYIAVFYLIGLLIILAAIPWPFSAHPRPYF